MESILWALDLLAVLFLCRWALRADISEAKEAAHGKKAKEH